MTMCAAGVPKLIEECGELQQVLGKLLAWWELDEPHWDGSILRFRLIEEIGDVSAAMVFVVEQLGLDDDAVTERMHAKLALFETWQGQLDNNDHGIDAAAGRVEDNPQ